jgi:ketosteroid isomerase-like protein
MSEIEPTINAYFAAVNGERYDRVAALFAPGAELVAPGIEPLSDPAEIESYLAAALRPYPQHRDEVTRTIFSGRTAIVEIHFSGALASGQPLEFDAVDIFDCDGESRIARLSTWYDSHAVRAGLRRAGQAGKAAG